MLNWFDQIANFRRELRQVRSRRDLDFLLASADPLAPLEDRIVWLKQIMHWLRLPVTPANTESKSARQGLPLQSVRLRLLLHMLDRNPEWRGKVSAVLRSILRQTSAIELFSLNALAREPGFFSEAMNRVFSRILPGTVNWHDLGPVFARIFNHPKDAEWIESLSPEIFAQITALITEGEPTKGLVDADIRFSLIDALEILGANIAATGLRADIRSRMSEPGVAISSFSLLNQKLLALCTKLRKQNVDPLHDPLGASCEAEIKECRARIADVFAHLEQTGVSVALVFRLESLTAFLSRVDSIVGLLFPHISTDVARANQRFVAELIRESQEGASLRSHIQRNFDLLSRKVVERVGVSGEHYITTTPREYFEMLRAGAGGGIITIFTALLKNGITHAHLALFFEGLFSGLNYSISFLLMQAAHFALATKQPSMTASALANKLRGLNHRAHLEEFIDEVAKITRSQVAAAIGNVGFAIPSAILFDMLVVHLTGHHAVDAEYSKSIVASFNPLTSITIPAAAFTGVVLWSASVTGGWLENWSAYRRIPEAIANNRTFRSVVGEERARRWADRFAHEINAFGANVSVGFYLAFTPIFGRFFGLPLDVRHVTLSTASLSFAVCSIGLQNIDTRSLVMACIGIFVILLLNFGVSFSLALIVALRARRIKRAWVFALLRGVGRRFFRKPAQFILPTRL